MADDSTSRAAADRSFETKVRRAKVAAVFEQLWLRAWLVLLVVGLFLLVSYTGIWPRLGVVAHVALLALFALAFGAALVYAARIPWPTREGAIRRIERVSGLPHRPASTYEDTISSQISDPVASSIWQAHRERVAAMLSKLKTGTPQPRTDRFDPFAVRALFVLFLVLLTALVGDGAADRLASAFRLGSQVNLAETRLDAWVTPPAYTGRAPVMLSDGAVPVGKSTQQGAKIVEVPERSVVIVRTNATGTDPLAIEISSGVEPQRIEAERRQDANGVQELRYELNRSAIIRALLGGSELARWQVDVTPDLAPKISLTRPPELTPRGSVKLTYKVEDDYGLASASVKLEKIPPKPADSSTAWAQPEKLTGPRPPLRRPPALNLRLPPSRAKQGEAFTYFEFASHPWAGLPVKMTLEAKDVAGQTGSSQPLEMVLPERKFTKPLARAVAEQRRKLLDDTRYRSQVMKALDALTFEPEGFIDDTRIYLGLRSVYHRLENDRTRAGMKSSIDQLWFIALKIEEGDLSDAERAMKEAQERLSKALENGASDEEIKRLTQELRQALQDYMKQLAQENGQEGQEQPEGQDQQNQMLSQQDLERMMKNLEEMAKNGSREQAQQLLSEMRDLMERLQSGRMDEAQAKKNQEMLQMMDELGDMVGDQQQLMDDTFNEQRDGSGQDGQRPPPGMRGMGAEEGKRDPGGGAPAGKGQRGQQRGQRNAQGGQGQEGQQGLGDPLGRGNDQRQGMGLSERQRELRERLNRLQKELSQKGAGSSDELDSARDSMESAEKALEQGDLGQATEDQGRALEQMRQGAQSMAQEMLRNMPQRYGQSGDTPRDPLGRPQRTQGPDLGTSVKVPDQIDVQRAREILEELRRRLGEATRPPVELDYLERLLRRF